MKFGIKGTWLGRQLRKQKMSLAGKDWHRKAIGAMWDEIGEHQFNFLVQNGMKPDHLFLDIGCGCLRGGVHAIGYLETGHYYGIEKEAWLLKAGKDIELKRYNIEHKKPNLRLTSDFDLSTFESVQFDFMLALSVFTHLEPHMVDLCLSHVGPSLKSTGVFFATFNESTSGDVEVGVPHELRKDEWKVVRYPFSVFEELAAKNGLKAEYIGEWDYPTGPRMKMLCFRSVST
jgi:hypothetical protein